MGTKLIDTKVHAETGTGESKSLSSFDSLFWEAGLTCFFFFLRGVCKIAVANGLKLSSAFGPS